MWLHVIVSVTMGKGRRGFILKRAWLQVKRAWLHVIVSVP